LKCKWFRVQASGFNESGSENAKVEIIEQMTEDRKHIEAGKLFI
jgi:hypothetical protein